VSEKQNVYKRVASYVVYMVATHIRTSKKDRTYIYIPSFLRKDFNITKDSTVDITKENGKIVITIINAGDSE